MGEITDIYELAKHVAISGGEKALQYFRNENFKIINKGNLSFNPATAADFESEKIMREIIEKERPNDSILGEEFQEKIGKSDYQWVLDPIDGTKAFIAGIPVWGVLVALNRGNSPLIGVIYQPFTKEIYSGKSNFSELKINKISKKLKTSNVKDVKKAILSTTFPEFESSYERKLFKKVKDNVKFVRYGLDCYAYALLAHGKIDIIIESNLKKYDIQAPHAVIEGAGGILTDWKGNNAYEGGSVLASSNKTLHKKLLEILNDN